MGTGGCRTPHTCIALFGLVIQFLTAIFFQTHVQNQRWRFCLPRDYSFLKHLPNCLGASTMITLFYPQNFFHVPSYRRCRHRRRRHTVSLTKSRGIETLNINIFYIFPFAEVIRERIVFCKICSWIYWRFPLCRLSFMSLISSAYVDRKIRTHCDPCQLVRCTHQSSAIGIVHVRRETAAV